MRRRVHGKSSSLRANDITRPVDEGSAAIDSAHARSSYDLAEGPDDPSRSTPGAFMRRAGPGRCSLAEPRAIDVGALKPRLERAFDFAAGQVRATIERYPDFFPIYTEDGRWQHRGELWTDWCGGFHAGMMWLIAERTGDPWWRQAAEHYSRLLEPRQHDRDVHDLGFIFLNTYLPWYRADRRRAAPRGADHRRADAGPAVQPARASISARSWRRRACSSTS